MSIYKFKPTYLYIKQHSVTGKLYFGKTIRKNPVTYNGSGIHWVNHIKKHGKEHVETLWYCLFYEQESCMEFALMVSEQENIVESDNWLNKIPETGIDAANNTGRKQTTEEIEVRRLKNTGKKRSEEQKQALRKPKPPGFSEKLRIANVGKQHTAETKDKLRKLASMQMHTEESKIKCRDAISKLKWINNGINNKRITSNNILQHLNNGWVYGRIGKSNKFNSLQELSL